MPRILDYYGRKRNEQDVRHNSAGAILIPVGLLMAGCAIYFVAGFIRFNGVLYIVFGAGADPTGMPERVVTFAAWCAQMLGYLSCVAFGLRASLPFCSDCHLTVVKATIGCVGAVLNGLIVAFLLYVLARESATLIGH